MKQKPFTPQQFQAYCKLKPPSVLKIYLSILTISLVATVVIVTATSALRTSGQQLTNTMELVIGIMTGIVIIGPAFLFGRWLYRSIHFSKAKRQQLIKTFQALDWSHGTRPDIEDWPIVPSSIIHNLNPKNTWQVPRYLRLLGQLDSNPAECAWLDARYFFSSPQKSAFIYCHVALNDSYPHTIVDGKDGLFQNDLPARKGNVEHVSLEGTLHKHFDVFTIKGSGQKALYTLPPNVLEKLYDYGTAFNIEVIGNSLYVFAQPKELETARGFANFMNISLYLTRELNRRHRQPNPEGQPFRYISDYAQSRMDITTSMQQRHREAQ